MSAADELKQEIVSLLSGYSIEATPHDEEKLDELVAAIPAGTSVYVAWLPGFSLDDPNGYCSLIERDPVDGGIERPSLDLGLPERGDVVVFRYPHDTRVNYIKRVVGLPGDRVRVEDDRIYGNGEPLPEVDMGRYTDGCYLDMRLTEVRIGDHVHGALSCRTPDPLASFMVLPGCDRRIGRSYPCDESPELLNRAGVSDRGDQSEVVVPAGNYLMIGDNRDNSDDGRYWSDDGGSWGFVPEQNLVGSARRVWFNFDWDRTGWKKIDWGRIGERIE